MSITFDVGGATGDAITFDVGGTVGTSITFDVGGGTGGGYDPPIPQSDVTDLVADLAVAGRSHITNADLGIMVEHVDGTATTVKILGLSPGADTAGIPDHTVAVATFADLAAFAAALDGAFSGGAARVWVPEASPTGDADVAGVYDVDSATLTSPWTAVDPTPDLVEVGGEYIGIRVEDPAGDHFRILVSPTFLDQWLDNLGLVDDIAAKADFAYTGTGLYAGIEDLPAAVTASEGIGDRWLFGPGAYIDADAQALNLATLTTTGGAPTPTYGVAPDGSTTVVLVLGRTDPDEDGIYRVSAGLVWTKGTNPDIFDPPGNGYRFTVKPTGGQGPWTWMATMDEQGFSQRAGNFPYEAIIAGAPYTWTLLDTAGGSGPDLSDADPAALGSAAEGVSADASRADHVHPTTGLALSGHDHSGVYDPAGTAAALVDDLSGVSNASTARTNLGLGTAAVAATSDFLAANVARAWASRITILCAVEPPNTYTTWTPTGSAVIGSGYAAGATTASGETWTYANLPLRAGTWSIVWHWRRHSGGGIITPTLGGTSLTTVDTYNASTAGDQRQTQTGITVAGGLTDLVLTNPTKNASSSAYGWTLQAISLFRTGA